MANEGGGLRFAECTATIAEMVAGRRRATYLQDSGHLKESPVIEEGLLHVHELLRVGVGLLGGAEQVVQQLYRSLWSLPQEGACRADHIQPALNRSNN